MDKLLTIAIPRFRETEREIFPLLSSISNQLGVDMQTLEVIVVTDGGGGPSLDENYLSLFGFETKQLRLEQNRRCGVARQAAIDIARGTYILCCDADDVLFSVTSLATLLDEAEATGADLLISDFLEETRDQDGHVSYITHTPTACWMHGKLLRRDFLVDNGIRFHPDIRMQEDSYFLCIAIALAQNLRHLAVPTYVWCSNPNSITRSNGGAYLYREMPEYVQAMTLAWAVVDPLRPEQMEDKVVQFVNHMFFELHREGWKEWPKALEATQREMTQRLRPWMCYYHAASPEVKARSYNTERTRAAWVGPERETIAAWLQRLGLEGDRQ